MKIVFLVAGFFIFCTVSHAQKDIKLLPKINIYDGADTIPDGVMIFDEVYPIGYNNNGQFMYALVEPTDAADHDGYAILLFDAKTGTQKTLYEFGMEADNTKTNYQSIQDFFKAKKKGITTWFKKLNMENKTPVISKIKKGDYKISYSCKPNIDELTRDCTVTVTDTKTKKQLYKQLWKYIPEGEKGFALHRKLQIGSYSLLLYHTVQRGWEGTPYPVGAGFIAVK